MQKVADLLWFLRLKNTHSIVPRCSCLAHGNNTPDPNAPEPHMLPEKPSTSVQSHRQSPVVPIAAPPFKQPIVHAKSESPTVHPQLSPTPRQVQVWKQQKGAFVVSRLAHSKPRSQRLMTKQGTFACGFSTTFAQAKGTSPSGSGLVAVECDAALLRRPIASTTRVCHKQGTHKGSITNST